MSSNPVIPIPSTGGLAGLGADAAGLGQILNLLLGTSNTSTTNVGGSTQTTENIVDQEAIDKTIRDMLEGDRATNGLAALLTGQKAAGAYNSSTSNLMVNDLVSRIVGEVAKLTSKKVVTNSGQTNTTTNSTDGKAKEAAAAAAALAALKKALGAASNKTPPKAPAAPNARPNNQDTLSGQRRAEDMQAESDNTNRTQNDIQAETFTDDLARDSQELLSIDTGVDPDSIGIDLPTDFTDSDYTGDERVGIVEVGDVVPVGDGVGGGSDGEGGPGEGDGGTGGSNVDNDPDGDYGGGGGDGGCYITTAVIGARGLPDNCPELQILRRYRDSWLAKNHPEGIKMYYQDAPTLVAKIDRAPNSQQFYNHLYLTYIIPAIGFILAAKPIDAYNKYREMVVFVQKSVGAR